MDVPPDASPLPSTQRLLLWLAEAPPEAETTQGAIAAALGISRGQASRAAATLLRQGLAEQHRHRSAGFGRSMAAYGLTPAGAAEAARLRLALGPSARDGRAEPDRAPAPRPAGGGRFHLDLVEAPPPRPFVGRAAQRAEVERWLASGPPLLVTEASAGQGKSSLAAHVVRQGSIARHVLWVSVTESMRADGILARLDQFLRGLGRVGPPLAMQDPGALARQVKERVGRLALLVVLDDVQKASASAAPALHGLARAACALRNPKVWLLGREVSLPHDLLPEAERRPLGPLTDAEADAMLEALDVGSADRAPLVRQCKGNPLFLALAARSPKAPERGTDLSRYLLREVVPSLDPAGRDALEVLCALRRPASRTVLARLAQDPVPALVSLAQLELLAEDGSGQVAVHDLVRETLYGALPPERRRAMHARLAGVFEPRDDDWRDVTEFLHHLTRAGRRDEAVRWLLRNRSRFLEQADAIVSPRRPATPRPAAAP